MTATNTKTSVDTHTKTLIGSHALIGVVSVVSIGFTLGSSLTYAAVSTAAAKNNCDMTVADGDCDKDKVVNSQDNCILKKNKKQKDTNGDGYGNMCDADYDNNGAVGGSDWGIIARAYKSRRGSPKYNIDVDCNTNGVINNYDRKCFRKNYGKRPGPSYVDINFSTTLEVLSNMSQGNNVVAGMDNQLVGRMLFKAGGEHIYINKIGWTFEVDSETADVTDITNVIIKGYMTNTGEIFAGPIDPTPTSGNSSGTATTTDNFDVGPQSIHDIAISADLSNDFSPGDTITLLVYTSGIDAVGNKSGKQVTIDNISPSGASYNPPVNVRTTSLNVSNSTIPAAQTVISGTQDFESLNIILDATGSAGDVRVTKLAIDHEHTDDSFPNMLSGFQLLVGTTTIPIYSESINCGSMSCNTPGANAVVLFSIRAGDLTIQKGTSKTVTVLTNVGTGATAGTFTLGCGSDCVYAIDEDAALVSPTHTGSQMGRTMTLLGGTIITQTGQGLNTDVLETISSNGTNDAIVALKNGRWFGDSFQFSNDTFLSFQGDCSQLDHATLGLSYAPGGPFTDFASLGGPSLCETLTDVHGAGPEPYLRITLQGGTFEDLTVIFNSTYIN